MIRKSLNISLFVLAFAALCLAADPSGKWEGTINTPNGEIKLVFTFKVEGDKLTGTVESPRGERPITDGKVTGDELSFKVTAGDNVMTYQGKMAGDTLNMKSQGPRGERELVLKRAAAAAAKQGT
jgi:hypothetical protein